MRDKNFHPGESLHEKRNIVVVLLLLVIALLPLGNYNFFSVPISDYHTSFKLLLLGIPLAAIAFCYNIDIGLARHDKTVLFVLLSLLSLLLVDIHLVYVDTPSNMSCQFFPENTNLEYQQYIHHEVMNLSIDAIPHSYRFLPDSFVSLLNFVTNDFPFSKMIYRETFMFLLLFSIYYYSRLYYSHQTAIVTLLLYAVVYQISIRDYAGQLNDPLSHFLFILAFIFIELDLFAYLFLAVIIGIMAKESIAAMAVYYVLIQVRSRRFPVKAILLLLSCLAVVAAIRLYIVPDFSYEHISRAGTWPLIKNNIFNYKRSWHQVFYTVGIFLPFVILSWKKSATSVKNLVMFLLPVLMLAHTIIGFLWETRNLIPAAIPMALLTAHYLLEIVSNDGNKVIDNN